MGDPGIPDPAQVIVGVIHAGEDVLEAASAMLTASIGPVHLRGPRLPFRWTDYYEKEMGTGLERCFLVSESLIERELLADLKHLTNRFERELSNEDGSRRINLDPGLLSAEKLVLASTKNFGHRVYLRDGIFAEVTLRYRRGNFESFDWTFPDYGSKEIREFLESTRKEYMKILRGPSPRILLEVKT